MILEDDRHDGLRGVLDTMRAPFVAFRRWMWWATMVTGTSAMTLLSCAPRTSLQPAALPQTIATAAQRRAVVDTVWNHIRAHYFEDTYHGVDWDAVHAQYAPIADTLSTDSSMHRLLARMVAELRDAHSRYLDPVQAVSQRTRTSRTIGVRVEEVQGVPLITAVNGDSPAARAGVVPGMSLVAVNGVDARQLFETIQSTVSSSTERAVRAFAWRRTTAIGDSVISLAVEHHGQRREVQVARKVVSDAPKVHAKLINDSVLYVEITGFRRGIAAALRDTLQRYANATQVVVDLRNNGGGDANETLRATGVFLPGRTNAGEFYSRFTRRRFGLFRSADVVRLSAGGSARADTRPLVLLTSVFTGSGGELMSALLQEVGRARIVGDTTCGCLTAVTSRRSLPGGGMVQLSNRGYRTPKGVVIERRGVIPNLVVRPTRDDILAQRDVTLEAAMNLFNDAAVTSGIRN